jgi:hypothetical protein
VAFGDDLLPAANRVVSVLTDITRAIEDNYENSELFRYALTGPIGYLASQVDDIEELYEDLADVSKRISEIQVVIDKIPEDKLENSQLLVRRNDLLAEQLELRKKISQIDTDRVGPDGSVDDTSKPVIEDNQNNTKVADKKYTSTKDGLQFQLDQLSRTNREQEVYNALRQAGAKADTEAGKAISELAGKIYDITESRKELNEAIKAEDEQTKAVEDVEQEIANIEREAQALLQGKEAYEAYQEAREIEQGSEAIRERLEALGLEEEQIDRLTAAYERHSEELDKAEEVAEKREEAVERQKQSEQELADILENGIGRSLSAAADGWDALGKVALDVLGQMIAKSLDLESALSGAGGGSGGGGIFSTLLSGLGSGIGSIFGFADGGKIVGPGGPRSDSILAAVSNGEYVVNAAATAKNLPLLEAINKGGLPAFADGGFVGGAVPRVPDISKTMSTINNNSRSSSSNNVTYNIDARGAEVGVEQKIKQALDEREPLIIEGAVQQVQEENYRSGSRYLGGM